MNSNILKAIQAFELDHHHEKIFDNPNELIAAGFPASFLLPLINVFRSSDGYQYFRNSKAVDEMIGIRHAALIYAIAEHLGVPPDTGSHFTGRGSAMRANIDAIREILSEQARGSG